MFKENFKNDILFQKKFDNISFILTNTKTQLKPI